MGDINGTLQLIEDRLDRLYKRFGCPHGRLTYDASQDGRNHERCEDCNRERREWMNARMDSHP